MPSPQNWEPTVPWFDIFERPDWLTILYKLWKLNRGQTIYLWSKVVCFVRFVRLRSSKPRLLHAALLVSLESSWWVGGVHRLYWVGWKILLLIIEPFFHWKLNEMETENCIEILEGYCCSCFCWKALGEWDLMEFSSQFSELRCGRYWFLSGFCSKPKFSCALNVFTLGPTWHRLHL